MKEQLNLVAGNVKALMKAIGASSGDIWNVKPEHIRVIEGFNVRTDTPEYLAHVAAIKESIRVNGFMRDKPLAGFVSAEEGGLNILSVTEGGTRLRAVNELIDEGVVIDTVPMVVKPRGTSMEDLNIALITSNNGKDFTPYETGIVIKRLVDFGMAEKDIAKRLGFTTPYVQDLLSLVGAPKVIRDMVIAGQVSATTAIKELTEHGAKAVSRLKSGLEEAKAAGKEKVTAKHLKPAAEKAPKAEKPSKLTFPIDSTSIKFLASGNVSITLSKDLFEYDPNTDEITVVVKRKVDEL